MSYLGIYFLFMLSGGYGETAGIEGTDENEAAALHFLELYEVEASIVCNHVMEATWNYHTNVTEFNKNAMLLRQLQGKVFKRKKWEEASQFRWKSFSNPGVRRLFSYATVLGSAALSEQDSKNYSQILQEMKSDFSRATICSYKSNQFLLNNSLENDFVSRKFTNATLKTYDCVHGLSLEPDLTRIMAESRDPKELLYIWRAWREKSGKPQRKNFLRYVELSNKAARLNGFSNTAEMWQREYESEFFEKDLERIWEQLRPLYEQLHTYVRRKLVEKWGNEIFNGDGTIPAHLLGNMWGQSWTNLLNLAIPYPERPFTDITRAMRQQGYNAFGIFRLAEDFFMSLGLDPLPRDFYTKSMLQKPIDRDVICHSTSWDFCNGRDYRINHCTQTTLNDLLTAHHEIGHVNYAMNYRHLPLLLREGANPGFHEAVGDAIGLSASTPSHMLKLRLLNNLPHSHEDDINFLFKTALDKVAFLPFGYLVDQWRWKIFREEIPVKEINTAWWELRIRYQGISPPIQRGEDDFDTGAKYHVIANIPYIRYFIGHVLQFQIHEELCRVSGFSGPLHQCDIYGSKAAGTRLRKMMNLGKSKPWPLALSELTDGRTQELNASAMLRYFSNLTEWLKIENRGDKIGWSSNAAITSLRVNSIKVSSSNFIGLVLGLCAAVLLLIFLGLFFHRKIKKKISSSEVQREMTRPSLRRPQPSTTTVSVTK